MKKKKERKLERKRRWIPWSSQRMTRLFWGWMGFLGGG
jgi:hypothetical protein